jgi:hypothetical protein
MPIPNGFLSEKELKKKEPRYPLSVSVCQQCWLVQLTHVIPAEIMFKNYLYIPSTSLTMLKHFESFADEILSTYNLTQKDLVIDIGSNDGTLLQYFKNQEVQVLGIDPASNLAQVARLRGINTLDTFFTNKLAKTLIKNGIRPKIITATNVIAHINDLHDVCKGVSILLDKAGVFIMEYPYLLDLLEKNEFDTIYHEHLSYFSITSLNKLFKLHNLKIIKVKKLPVHGGSIRVYVVKDNSNQSTENIVGSYLKKEQIAGISKLITYKKFAKRVKMIKLSIIKLLKELKTQNKKIVGYGASAKGNVMLNYCGIDTKYISYIVDSISYKQGMYTPGTHIPIYPESRLEKEMPDYALLLSWNFADEILRKNICFREKGGQFIITIPHLRIE